GFFFYSPTRPNTQFDAVRTNEDSRTSHYNGMLVSLNKNLSHHVQFNASYTWSHALTSGEDFFGLSEPGDFVNTRPELGPAFNDIRHAVNMGVVLDSGRMFTNHFMGAVGNNLGLSWVGQLQSGRPYPLSTGTSPFGGSARFFGAGSETQQRPNITADGTVNTSGIASFDGGTALFGPGAVAACIAGGFPTTQCNAIQNAFAPPVGVTFTGAVDAVTGEAVTFSQVNGNLGRDAARGSPFYKFDASLHKDITMPRYENIKLELRFDAFNVFNHTNATLFNTNDVLNVMSPSVTNIGTPGATVNSDFFTCTGCMRPNGTYVGNNGKTLTLADLQKGGKILSSPFNGLGDPGSDDGPRKLQLSFHVRF
ncbi:MAG TPA: hypothetical protein VGH51_01605, partial [Candidatus Angelobacter sp.]